MPALQVTLRNAARLGIERRVQRLDEAGFAYPGLSADEADALAADLPELVQPLSADRRGANHPVTRFAVDFEEILHSFGVGLSIEVHLVEDYDNRNLVNFAGYEYPVEERQLYGREIEADCQHCTVEVGGYHV